MRRIHGSPRPLSPEEQECYRENFLESWHEGGVVCLECGGRYILLAPHVRQTHEITHREYKAKWGFDRKTPLATSGFRETQRRHAIARRIWTLGRPADAIRKATEVRLMRAPHPHRPEARLAQRERLRRQVAAGWRPKPTPSRVDDDTLRAFVQEGFTTRQVAARVGLSASQVCRRLRTVGLAAAHSQRRVSDAELLALREQGLWCKQIAQRVGINVAAVHKRLRRLQRRGITVPPPAGPRPHPGRRATDEQIEAMAQQGLTVREIAAQLSITPASVYRRLAALRRRGLLPPAPPRPLSDEKDHQILALRQVGLWTSQIASRIGLSQSAVQERLGRLQRRGIAMPPPAGPRPHPGRRATDEQLLDLTQDGLRPLDIAARVRMAPKSVWRRLSSLRRRGLLPARPRRSRPFVSPEDLSSYRRDIRRALREDRAVCLECGRLLRSVANHLKVHGLTAGAYREKWGYNRRRGLVNRATHDLMSNSALARGVSRLASHRRTLNDGQGRRVSRTPRRLEMRLDQHDRMRARLATGWRPPAGKKVEGDTLRALVAAGLTFSQIAARTGLNYSTVRNRIRGMGLLSPAITPFRLKASNAALLAFCRAGLSTRQIAARTGMTVHGVRARVRHLRRRGLLPEQAAAPAQGSLAEG